MVLLASVATIFEGDNGQAKKIKARELAQVKFRARRFLEPDPGPETLRLSCTPYRPIILKLKIGNVIVVRVLVAEDLSASIC